MTFTVPSPRRRVIDIVTAAVLGVACGLIFVVWSQAGSASYGLLKTIGPGVGGLVTGAWLLGGTFGGYVIRKPGAAFFVELMAATVPIALGSQWAVETIHSGLAQGLGAEAVSVLVAYRRFNATIVGVAGAVSSAFEWVLRLFLSGHLAEGVLYNVVYPMRGMASGIVLAGLFAWALTNAFVETGALDRPASGRGAREFV